MPRIDGTIIAGGSLARNALSVFTGSLAAAVLAGCNLPPGRMDENGHYLGPNTVVSWPDWGVVSDRQPLYDETVAVRIAACLRPLEDEARIGTPEEFAAIARNPAGSTALVGSGFVEAADGTVYSCEVDLRAPESSGYTVGQVVAIPDGPPSAG